MSKQKEVYRVTVDIRTKEGWLHNPNGWAAYDVIASDAMVAGIKASSYQKRTNKAVLEVRVIKVERLSAHVIS